MVRQASALHVNPAPQGPPVFCRPYIVAANTHSVLHCSPRRHPQGNIPEARHHGSAPELIPGGVVAAPPGQLRLPVCKGDACSILADGSKLRLPADDGGVRVCSSRKHRRWLRLILCPSVTAGASALDPVVLPTCAGVVQQTPLSRPECALPLKLGSLSRFSVDQ